MTSQTMVNGLIYLGLLVALAPLFRGLTELLSRRLEGRHGARFSSRYGEIAALFTQKSSIDRTAGMFHELAPALALATIAAGVLLLPSVVHGPTETARSAAFTLIALVASSRVVVALAAIDRGGIVGGIASIRNLGERTLLEPALMLATIAAIHATQDAERTGTVFLGFILAAAASAIAIWTLTAASRSAGLTAGRAALIAQYSGPPRALLEVASDLRDVLLWSLWITLFLPVGSGGERLLASPLVAVAILAGKLILIASISALAHAHVTSRKSVEAARLPATALGLAIGAFLLSLLAQGVS